MKRHVDHNKRHLTIVQEALALFSELGYPQFTAKLLAERCGISRTVLYRYFSTKRDVFDAVLDYIIENFRVEFRQYVQENPNRLASEKIRMILTRLMEFIEENVAFIKALVDFLIDRREAGENVRRRVMRYTVYLRLTLVRLIREGTERGEFKVIHATQVAEMFFDELIGAAMQLSVTDTHSPEGFRARLALGLSVLKNYSLN